MPVADIVGEALGGIVRFIGRTLLDFVFELLLRGTGQIVLSVLRPSKKPAETEAAITGLMFWCVTTVGGFWLFLHAAG